MLNCNAERADRLKFRYFRLCASGLACFDGGERNSKRDGKLLVGGSGEGGEEELPIGFPESEERLVKPKNHVSEGAGYNLCRFGDKWCEPGLRSANAKTAATGALS